MTEADAPTLALSGRVALVTGSTSGIGLGMAEALANAGAAVMLHGLGDRNEIETLRARIAATSNRPVRFFDADARKGDEMENLVHATIKQMGGLDILINNAGVQHVAPIEEFPPDRWQAIQDVIINSSFHTIRAAVPHMRQQGWGRIIQLASAHALVASPFKSAYVSAKHAQIGLTKSVALEVAAGGITCNAICPGYVRTALVEGQIRDQAQRHGISEAEVIRDVMLASQPTKRFVTVEEVAALAVFLCGESAGSITGTAIPIDGGWTAR